MNKKFWLYFLMVCMFIQFIAYNLYQAANISNLSDFFVHVIILPFSYLGVMFVGGIAADSIIEIV